MIQKLLLLKSPLENIFAEALYGHFGRLWFLPSRRGRGQCERVLQTSLRLCHLSGFLQLLFFHHHCHHPVVQDHPHELSMPLQNLGLNKEGVLESDGGTGTTSSTDCEHRFYHKILNFFHCDDLDDQQRDLLWQSWGWGGLWHQSIQRLQQSELQDNLWWWWWRW